MKRCLLTTLFALTASAWSPTHAGTLSANMNVSLTVVGACSSIAVSPMNFGTWSAGQPKHGAFSTLTINCNSGAEASLTIGNGFNPGADGLRAMKHQATGALLKYQLSMPDPVTGVEMLAPPNGPNVRVVGGKSQSLLVDGVMVETPQGSIVGSYTDVVTFTLNF